MNTGLDQYMDIFKDAVEDSAAKLTKSFEKILIEVIILFMVIPRKINFTQMGRYGSHVEQTYRNAFGLKKSKSIDWLKLNVSLAKRFFGKQGRWAIAILYIEILIVIILTQIQMDYQSPSTSHASYLSLRV